MYENTKNGAKELAKKLKYDIQISSDQYKIDNGINTIYLAGAPGSGKTEFIKTIEDSEHFIIIDIDSYRYHFKGYNGTNAGDFQDSCSRVATSIYKYCLQNELKLIFDGTLTSEIGIQNISKAVKKDRSIGIIYIYQDPIISYSFTKARQITNERNVPLDNFISIYYNSIEFTFKALKKYENIAFVIASKKKDKTYSQITSIQNKKKFDSAYKVDYNRDSLTKKLSELDDNGFYQLILKKLGLKKN